MTKAEQILDLNDGTRSNKDIAAIVGCLPAYVRVVLHQRKGTGQSENDLRYLQSSLGKAGRARVVARTFKKRQAHYVALITSGDKDAANAAARRARRAARLAGMSIYEAKTAAINARHRVLRKTADQAKARAAYNAAPLVEINGQGASA